MSSPDEEWDAGVAVERTALSWERSGLSLMAVAALTVATAAERGEVWALAGAGLVALGGAATWWHGRATYRTRQPIARVRAQPRHLRLLSAGTVLAAALALAMVLVPAV